MYSLGSELALSPHLDAHWDDIHSPIIQAENENDPSKEYENPDFYLSQNEGRATNKDPGPQSYETIDIMKVDYVSVYNTPNEIIQNKASK